MRSRVTLSRRCVNVDACKGSKDVERERTHRLLFVLVEAAGNEAQNATLLCRFGIVFNAACLRSLGPVSTQKLSNMIGGEEKNAGDAQQY